MPRSSHSKNFPNDVGKTSARAPACPKINSSMSRPNAGLNQRWYSRFTSPTSHPNVRQLADLAESAKGQRRRLAGGLQPASLASCASGGFKTSQEIES